MFSESAYFSSFCTGGRRSSGLPGTSPSPYAETGEKTGITTLASHTMRSSDLAEPGVSPDAQRTPGALSTAGEAFGPRAGAPGGRREPGGRRPARLSRPFAASADPRDRTHLHLRRRRPPPGRSRCLQGQGNRRAGCNRGRRARTRFVVLTCHLGFIFFESGTPDQGQTNRPDSGTNQL